MSLPPHDQVVALPVGLEGRAAVDELADELVALLEDADTPTRFAFATMLAAARLPEVTGTLVVSVAGGHGELRASFSSP